MKEIAGETGMSKKLRIHYAGSVKAKRKDGVSIMLPGWAVCCSGERARKIRVEEQYTYDYKEVTCKTCLKTMALHLVTVCDNCLCASCIQGEFYCDKYKTAGTAERTVGELRKLARENEHYYWRNV